MKKFPISRDYEVKCGKGCLIPMFGNLMSALPEGGWMDGWMMDARVCLVVLKRRA